MKKYSFIFIFLVVCYILYNPVVKFSPPLSETSAVQPPETTIKPQPIEKKTENIPPEYQCEAKKKCSQMRSCEEAKFYLQQCNLKRLDRNKDGIPCQSRHCYKKSDKLIP